MTKTLFKTKEDYQKALDILDQASEPKLPHPEYPQSFPAVLCVDVCFHAMYRSTQFWVYLKDFEDKSSDIIDSYDPKYQWIDDDGDIISPTQTTFDDEVEYGDIVVSSDGKFGVVILPDGNNGISVRYRYDGPYTWFNDKRELSFVKNVKPEMAAFDAINLHVKLVNTK